MSVGEAGKLPVSGARRVSPRWPRCIDHQGQRETLTSNPKPNYGGGICHNSRGLGTRRAKAKQSTTTTPPVRKATTLKPTISHGERGTVVCAITAGASTCRASSIAMAKHPPRPQMSRRVLVDADLGAVRSRSPYCFLAAISGTIASAGFAKPSISEQSRSSEGERFPSFQA